MEVFLLIPLGIALIFLGRKTAPKTQVVKYTLTDSVTDLAKYSDRGEITVSRRPGSFTDGWWEIRCDVLQRNVLLAEGSNLPNVLEAAHQRGLQEATKRGLLLLAESRDELDV